MTENKTAKNPKRARTLVFFLSYLGKFILSYLGACLFFVFFDTLFIPSKSVLPNLEKNFN